jgi:hypothetical protein
LKITSKGETTMTTTTLETLRQMAKDDDDLALRPDELAAVKAAVRLYEALIDANNGVSMNVHEGMLWFEDGTSIEL